MNDEITMVVDMYSKHKTKTPALSQHYQQHHTTETQGISII